MVKKKLVTMFAVVALTSIAGCGASKEETSKQLALHMDAYRGIEVTRGNASSLVKSINLLLDQSDKNSFKNSIAPADKSMLIKLREKATKFVECMNIIANDNYGLAIGGTYSSGENGQTVPALRSRLETSRKLFACHNVVSDWSLTQKSAFQDRLKTEETKLKMVELVEKRKAEEARRKEEEAAAEQARLYEKAKIACVSWLMYYKGSGMWRLDAVAAVDSAIFNHFHLNLTDSDRNDCADAVFDK